MSRQKTYLFVLSAIIHVAFLAFGWWQDSHVEQFGRVRFTDVDYDVITDGARLVAQQKSPYDRHTYRYSPFLAFLMLPNLLVADMGKVFFCVMNFIIGFNIENLVRRRLLLRGKCSERKEQKGNDGISAETLSTILTALWLCNPVVITIATRGNADCLPVLFVVLFLDFFSTKRIVPSAIALGFAVHIKLYPVIYAIPAVCALKPHACLGVFSNAWRLLTKSYSSPSGFTSNFTLLLTTILQLLDRRVWAFTFISLGVFLTLTLICYLSYGWISIYEGYLYHFIRQDHRHNLSPMHYFMYLSLFPNGTILSGFQTFSVALCKASSSVAQFGTTLIAGIFCAQKGYLEVGAFVQTVLFVALNKVCTTQYFVWSLALLPPTLAAVVPLSSLKEQKRFATLVFLGFSVWLAALGVWMLFGYQLEFEGKATYIYLWFAGWLFSIVSIVPTLPLLRNLK